MNNYLLDIANVILAFLLCYIVWKEGNKFRPSTMLLCVILGTIAVVIRTIVIIDNNT